MPFVATPIKVSKGVAGILNGFARSRTLPLSKIQRAKIIIGASEGKNNQEIAKQVGVTQEKASNWRLRWASNAKLIEETEDKNPQKLLEIVENVLKDLPRPGSPPNFTEVQIIQILELACRHPSEFGYESSHWSLPQLAKAVVAEGIAPSISPASVGRFLKYGTNSTSQDKILVTLNR
jgi:putative transposase